MLLDEIFAILPRGKANAITGEEIASQFGIPKRTVQAVIQTGRLQGYPICGVCYGGGGGGYYKPSEASELRECIDSLKRRHLETARTIRALEILEVKMQAPPPKAANN